MVYINFYKSILMPDGIEFEQTGIFPKNVPETGGTVVRNENIQT